MKYSYTKFIILVLSALAAFSWHAGLVRAEVVLPSEVLTLMNQDREAVDLPDLLWSDTLFRAAEMRLSDMEANQYFAHESPSGVSPWMSFDRVGYRYRYAGENLAIHFSDATSEEKAWMESLEHRDNILNVRYHEAGVAVREIDWKGNRTILAVVLFGTRVGDTAFISSSTLPSPFSQTLSKPEVAGVAEEGASQKNGVKSSQPISEAKSDISSMTETMTLVSVSRHSLFTNFWTTILLMVIGILELSMAILIFRAYLFAASLQKQRHHM